MRILMMLTGARAGRPSRAPGFDQVIEPFYLLQDAGAELVVASLQGGDPTYRATRKRSARAIAALERFHEDRQAREAISDTLRFAQIYPDDFDGGLCLGVIEHTAAVDDTAIALDLVAALLAAGKPVAVVPSDSRLTRREPTEGILITGDRARSPLGATKALLAALGPRDS
jgi:hypothetical protein